MSVEREVRSRFPDATIERNRGPSGDFKMSRSASQAEGFQNYVNVRTQETLRYPRLGAFEVELNGRVGT